MGCRALLPRWPVQPQVDPQYDVKDHMNAAAIAAGSALNQTISLSDVRARVRREIRVVLSERRSECFRDPALVVLYNWSRNRPAHYGFTPRSHVAVSGMCHPQETLMTLLESPATGSRLAGLLSSETSQLRAEAQADFKAWRCSAQRSLYAVRFNELPAKTPGMKALLQKIARLTPHGQSTAYQHGRDAAIHWRRILTLLRAVAMGHTRPCNSAVGCVEEIRLPRWAENAAAATWLLGAIARFPMTDIEEYLENHDVGKAFCLTRDAEGGVHYPNHAEVSATVWAKAGGTLLECELMRKDMVIHTASAADCIHLATDPVAPILLLAALGEIHANAETVFAGRSSDSFKIKFKQIDRRGNTLMKLWLG